MRLLTVCAAALLLAGFPGRAGAQAGAGEARRLVAEGIELGKAGQYRAALERFHQAERLHPSAEHDCYIAVGYVRLAQLSRARFYLDRCRERGRGERPVPWYSTAAERIERLLRQRRYAPVELKVEPREAEVSLRGLEGEALRTPLVVWLPPGPHEIHVRRAGYQAQTRSIVVEAGQRLAVLISLVEVAEVRLGPELPASPPALVGGPAPTAVDRQARGRSPRRTVGWSAIGGGGAAMLVGTGFYLSAYRSMLRARDAETEPVWEDAVADLRRNRAVSMGFLGAGALTVGTGLYLVLRSEPDRQLGQQLSVSAWGRGAALVVHGRF